MKTIELYRSLGIVTSIKALLLPTANSVHLLGQIYRPSNISVTLIFHDMKC